MFGVFSIEFQVDKFIENRFTIPTVSICKLKPEIEIEPHVLTIEIY